MKILTKIIEIMIAIQTADSVQEEMMKMFMEVIFLLDKDYFNSVAFEWDEISEHKAEKINYILEKIKLNTGQSVLDIGSGTGVMLPYIKKRVGKDG